MKKLLILTDEQSEFLVSKADFKNYTSMDVGKIKNYFIDRDYEVTVCRFSELDLNNNYRGVCILYQSSEAPGAFYKRYIENLIYYLEKQGAIALPKYEFLRAHHDKTSMEFLRAGFTDKSLKSLQSWCYGSWVDAKNYNFHFPVVIKATSGSGGAAVFLAKNKTEYNKFIKRAGKVIIARNLGNLFINYLKKTTKKIIKYFDPSKRKYYWSYNTTPESTPIVVQTFVEGLRGDYKVLIFGRKFYMLYRKNRDNDFRASGSGRLYEVPEKEHVGLLNFAKKITEEIDFPIIGMDIGHDGNKYHLIEFQMIDLGPSTLQISKFWYEFNEGKWFRYDGKSELEEEFSRAISNYIDANYQDRQSVDSFSL